MLSFVTERNRSVLSITIPVLELGQILGCGSMLSVG